MAETTNGIDGRVLALEEGQTSLGRRLENGFNELGSKFDNFAQRTDTRFETIQQARLLEAQGRSSSFWQYAISAAGLAVALYTLTKEPVSDKFAQQAADIKALQINTVPVRDINEMSDKIKLNDARIFEQAKDIAGLEAANKSQDVRLSTLSERIQTIFEKNFATPAYPCVGPNCVAPKALAPEGERR